MSEDIAKLECQYLHKLTKYVKSKCKRRIIDYLSLLKDDPKCSKILLNGHVLSQLTSLLEYQDTTIMNLTLSILANACLSAGVRHKMRDTKVVKQTLWIINNLESEDILNCRVCRLIGNLCESSYHAKAFHKAGVVKALAALLLETKSTATNLMIVRATRNLWWYSEDSREDIIKKNLIQSITKIFENTINESNPAKNRPDLGEACLKAICTFLTRVNSEEGQLNLKIKVAHQLRGSKDTSGYMTLVKYCKQKNQLAIKILFNLCQLPECRPDLGNCGAVQIIINLVSNEETMSRYTLYSLCLFSREAVNRFHIRTHSGLEFILNLLKNPKNESYHLHLLETLTNFIFDEESIVIMLKNGLLDILTDRLKMLKVTSQDDENKEEEDEEDEEKKVSKKRRRADSFVQMENKPRIKINRYSFDHCNEDWSPMSMSSGMYSPPNSPPGTAEEEEEGNEENYSPVCSDNEQEEEVESLKSVRSLTYYLDEEENEEQISENVLDNFNNALTLTLLDTICHLKDPVKNLADPNIIEPLVTYIKGSKNQKAFQILCKIVRKHLYLTTLIKQGFVFEAQTMYGSEQCVRQLCNLAATGGAIGELTTILSQGQETHRHITAISIPFLITSKYHLRNLLNDHGGLPLIFEVLNDNEHQFYEQAIWSICRLADSLKIQPEAIEKNLTPDIVSGIDDETLKPDTVTFVLDDGSTVDACRRTLCRKSDVFTAMFNGKFLESGKRKIDLKNTSREGLNTLLRALEGNVTFENNEIEPLLDAVVLADKFLMSGICDTLTESSISKLSYENYSKAWIWSRKNSCCLLKSYCVTKMFLTTRMTRSERARAFRDFSSCADFQDFLDEVWEIINNELGQR